MGFGEWLSGAGSALDKYLGGTGGEAIPTGAQQTMTTDEYAMPATQEVSANIEPVIPANQTIVTNSRDQSGEYRPVTEDTSAPSRQSFVESYVAPKEEISRIDYTKQSDLGDSKTQELMKQGYSPEQALAMQRDIAREAGNSRAVSYYQNEYDKALQSNIALSSAYHHDAMKSGLPQAPNPFAYAGDLALMGIYKSQGVSNVAGTGLLPRFEGSLLKDANIITKAERTGEMGDYKYLGRPFSSSEGILSLARQQKIGEDAATSKFNPEPWTVDRNIMSKYTPELVKGAGFNMLYKEAKLDEAQKASPGLLTKDYMASIVPGKEGKPTIQIGGSPAFEIMGGRVQPVTTGATGNMIAIASGKDASDINQFLLPEDMVKGGGKSDYKINVVPNFGGNKEPKTAWEDTGPTKNNLEIPDVSMNLGLPKTSVTGASRTVDIVNAPSSNWMNRYTGGRSGGDESVGGLKTSTFLLSFPTPRGSAMYRGDFGLTVGGTRLRKSKPSTPVIKRQPQSKKPYGMMTIDDHAILKNLGRDFFKFKVGTPDTVVKSNRARVSPIVNINTDGLGLRRTTKSTVTLPKINMPKGKSNTSVNINGILNRAIKKVKSK